MKKNLIILLLLLFSAPILSNNNTANDSLHVMANNGFYFSLQKNFAMSYQRKLNKQSAIVIGLDLGGKLFEVENSGNEKQYYDDDELTNEIEAMGADNDKTIEAYLAYKRFFKQTKNYSIFLSAGPLFKYYWHKAEGEATREYSDYVSNYYELTTIESIGGGVIFSLGIEVDLYKSVGFYAEYQGRFKYLWDERKDIVENNYSNRQSRRTERKTPGNTKDIEVQGIKTGIIISF